MCKRFERKLFHAAHPSVSCCCLSHVRLSPEYVAKADFGAGMAPVVPERVQLRFLRPEWR